jgi:hypothetical protein
MTTLGGAVHHAIDRSSASAPRAGQTNGVDVAPIHSQQPPAASSAPAPLITTGTVPRYRYQNALKSRDAYRRRADDLTAELAEARALNKILRDLQPDAAALLDAKRHISDLAHALSSVLVVFDRQGKVSGNTARYIRELLTNKGFKAEQVDLQEVHRG